MDEFEHIAKTMEEGHAIATRLLNAAMDATTDNPMVASLALGIAYASLMSANKISEQAAVELVHSIYARAENFRNLTGGSLETH